MGNGILPVTLSAALLVIAGLAGAAQAQPPAKMGPLLRQRVALDTGWSDIIVQGTDSGAMQEIAPVIQRFGGVRGRSLSTINGTAIRLPNRAIAALASHPRVKYLSPDRVVLGAMERTGANVGATAARQDFGYDGAGIGVAVIDSGAAWHDDLSANGGPQRVVHFVDYVNGHKNPYDDHGHGTHVAGIIAGNGFDSAGARSGIAPAASLIVLKVLNKFGRGRVSDVIAALDYVIAVRSRYNIRVVNLSVAAPILESYDLDPLTVAARRAVEAGLVVVAAAGNKGEAGTGRVQYGGITAPGNAPWVVTVGATSHAGTIDRADDSIARFSSRGPTAVDFLAKPDIVAPGVGIESLSAPGGRLYNILAPFLLAGTVPSVFLPYLSLTGTSMAAPVVTGTVALMLQANPSLTPNAVKAILQYTAQNSLVYNTLTEGSGLLNARGAVQLARHFADQSGPYPISPDWGRRVVWGTRLIRGGRIMPTVNAWGEDVPWGAATTPSGQPVEWGWVDVDGQATPWRVTCADSACSTFTASGGSLNVVWWQACGGSDCDGPWSVERMRTAASSASDADTIVWGTDDTETIVWGTEGGDTVVWGTGEDDTIVWGTDAADTIVWGTTDADTVVWGTQDQETIVWGTDGDLDTIVWGTNCLSNSCEPVIWGRQ
jgi:serine protease AprX